MKHQITAVRLDCRVCGKTPLVPLLSLGDLHVSDFVKSNQQVQEKFPLELVLCNKNDGGCGLVQLKHTVSHDSMYRNYWYRSGMNKTMTDELTGIARTVERIAHIKSGDYVVDIGANDGTLLRAYQGKGVHRIGYEPAKNLKKWNKEGTEKIFNDYFNFPAWKKSFGNKKAKAVTAIAMFYDLEDPNAFIADIQNILDPEGLFVIQMSYLPLMLSQNAFDNICHEHLEYYSLLSLEYLLNRHRLEVCDVELNDVNGGSYRIYIRHEGGGKSLSLNKGAAARVTARRAAEKKIGLHTKKVYEDFVKRILKIRDELVDFVTRERTLGKRIYVYGASTKGNTLLQFYGLDHTLIDAAAERNPDKWGTKTIGTHIPIVSEAVAREAKPDYFLALPWHFMKEFREREQEFLKKGGKFIVPLPEFRIVES